MRGGRTKVSQYVGAGNRANILSGGTESYTQVGGVLYKVLTFTSTGTLTVSALGGINAEYLVVAGGGGGGERLLVVAVAVQVDMRTRSLLSLTNWHFLHGHGWCWWYKKRRIGQ
jgi:hypothetical protein